MKNNFWRVDGLQEVISEKIATYKARDEIGPKITVLIVEPGEKPYVKAIGADDASVYCILEGPAEGRTLYGTGAEIVFNTFGKTLGLPACRALLNSKGEADDVIAGTFIITGVSEYGEYMSLNKEQIETFSNLFDNPICCWRYSLGFDDEF